MYRGFSVRIFGRNKMTRHMSVIDSEFLGPRVYKGMTLFVMFRFE